MAYNFVNTINWVYKIFPPHISPMEISSMRSSLSNKIIFLVAVFLASCTSPNPTISPTTTVEEVLTPTPVSTSTQIPTPTLMPSETPTITPSPIPTSTLSPTPDMTLFQVKLIGLAWYDNYDMLLSFQFPGPVSPDDYLVTLADKEYKCEVISGFPDRLYCRGQGGKVLAESTAKIYPMGSVVPGFEKKVWIPYFDNNYDSFNP